MGCKLAYVPMDASLPLAHDDSPLLQDVTTYRAIVDKLLYLTVTQPDIAFTVRRLSNMQAPRQIHCDGVCQVLRYLKSAPGKGLHF